MESLADPITVSADEGARCCSDWVIAPLNEEKFYHKKKRWLVIVCVGVVCVGVCVCVCVWCVCMCVCVCVCVCVSRGGVLLLALCWVHSRMNQQEISEVPVTFAWVNSFCKWKIR